MTKILLKIKQFRKIFLIITSCLLLLLLSLYAIFSQTIVQTKIAKEITRQINKNNNIDIYINRAAINIFKISELKNVYIEDYKKRHFVFC